MHRLPHSGRSAGSHSAARQSHVQPELQPGGQWAGWLLLLLLLLGRCGCCARAVISLCTLCAAACIADCLPHALLPPQVGTCDALTGLCTCQAGWQGFNCLMPLPRHCAVRYSSFGYERGRHEANLSMGIGWGSIFGFPESHCAGGCWTAGCPGCVRPALFEWASPGQVAGQAGGLAATSVCAPLWLMQARATKASRCATAPPTQVTAASPRRRMPLQVAFV